VISETRAGERFQAGNRLDWTERHPAAIHGAREHVTPQFIGAEWVLKTWGRQGSKMEMPESQISCDSINSVLTVLELPIVGKTRMSREKHAEL
jgi:hypothetical protein